MKLSSFLSTTIAALSLATSSPAATTIQDIAGKVAIIVSSTDNGFSQEKRDALIPTDTDLNAGFEDLKAVEIKPLSEIATEEKRTKEAGDLLKILDRLRHRSQKGATITPTLGSTGLGTRQNYVSQ